MNCTQSICTCPQLCFKYTSNSWRFSPPLLLPTQPNHMHFLAGFLVPLPDTLASAPAPFHFNSTEQQDWFFEKGLIKMQIRSSNFSDLNFNWLHNLIRIKPKVLQETCCSLPHLPHTPPPPCYPTVCNLSCPGILMAKVVDKVDKGWFRPETYSYGSEMFW